MRLRTRRIGRIRAAAVTLGLLPPAVPIASRPYRGIFSVTIVTALVSTGSLRMSSSATKRSSVASISMVFDALLLDRVRTLNVTNAITMLFRTLERTRPRRTLIATSPTMTLSPTFPSVVNLCQTAELMISKEDASMADGFSAL